MISLIQIISFVFGCTLLGLSFLITFKLPKFIDDRIFEGKLLKQDSLQWEIFKNSSIPFSFKVYFFHCQNRMEVQTLAEKPIFKEVGPYVYDLYYTKEDIDWKCDNNEIFYYENKLYIFNQEASGDLKANDSLTILNLHYFTNLYDYEDRMSEYQREKLEEMKVFEKILKSVFNGEETASPYKNSEVFVSTNVDDFLFNGLKFCDKESFIELENDGTLSTTESLCESIWSQRNSTDFGMSRNERDEIVISYFKNNSTSGRYGLKIDDQNVALLRYYNWSPYLTTWSGGNTSKCNKIDGKIVGYFPKGVERNASFDVFVEELCRSVNLKYQREETVTGLEGYRFVVSKDTFDAKTENICFCNVGSRNSEGGIGCLGEGLLDLRSCKGLPIIASFPHFLYADPKYLTAIEEGLRPDARKHESFVTLEPMTGVPLAMAKRTQFNMLIRKVDGIALTEGLEDTVVPIFWVEESLILPEYYVTLLNNHVFCLLMVLQVGKWVLMVLGACLVTVPLLLLCYKDNRQTELEARTNLLTMKSN